jgi:4-amino-4-deoxy-L-arabinose transferase-like glycosyltransferase
MHLSALPYSEMPDGHGKPRRFGLGLARGAGSNLSGLVVGIVVAAGVPLVWIWIASQLAGTKRDLTPSLAILIATGIVVSYWLVLLLGSLLRRNLVGEEQEQARQRRMSWNRSFRDEPLSANQGTDAIERLFIVIAVLAIIAFEIWFFFFAGSPLPNQPLF